MPKSLAEQLNDKMKNTKNPNFQDPGLPEHKAPNLDQVPVGTGLAKGAIDAAKSRKKMLDDL